MSFGPVTRVWSRRAQFSLAVLRLPSNQCLIGRRTRLYARRKSWPRKLYWVFQRSIRLQGVTVLGWDRNYTVRGWKIRGQLWLDHCLESRGLSAPKLISYSLLACVYRARQEHWIPQSRQIASFLVFWGFFWNFGSRYDHASLVPHRCPCQWPDSNRTCNMPARRQV